MFIFSNHQYYVIFHMWSSLHTTHDFLWYSTPSTIYIYYNSRPEPCVQEKKDIPPRENICEEDRLVAEVYHIACKILYSIENPQLLMLIKITLDLWMNSVLYIEIFKAQPDIRSPLFNTISHKDTYNHQLLILLSIILALWINYVLYIEIFKVQPYTTPPFIIFSMKCYHLPIIFCYLLFICGFNYSS